MGACLSKKKGSYTTTPVAPVQTPSKLKNPENAVTVTLSKPTNPEVNLKNEKKKTMQEKQQQDPVAPQDGETQVKREIFIIKHRKSHDDKREASSKIQPCTAQQNVPPTHSDDGLPSGESSESMGNNNNKKKIAPPTPNIGVGVMTSSCTKEEVDAILIQCGRLSRSSSGRAASSSSGAERGRKYSGSKRSYDFDHCDNDANSNDDDQRTANDNSDLCEEHDGVAASENRRHQHRQRQRQSPKPSPRRRTPSRERDQRQKERSSSRERRVSRSPGRRSSETTTSGANANANGSNNGNSTGSSRPGKMVSVPATVASLVMDKSNNGVGGGESAAAASIKRITVKRNVGECGAVGSRGAASPRSQSPARLQSPARANGKALSDNQQQQPSLSRNNSSRKAEQSPYRRNPLSEIDPNSIAYPQSNTNNGSSKVQNRPKKEIEAEASQKPYALEKGVSPNCNTKEQQQEEDIKALASMNDNVVVKRVVPSGVVESLKPQTLTRSRSSRRSRDLDLNPEALVNPTQSYTSLLLEDIQNFHQKNTTQPSISLPACLSKACSILEAVADLNSTTSSNFSGAFSEDKSPPNYRNEHSASLGGNNHYGRKRVADTTTTKDHPFVESEVLVSDDVMEPSLHKYVTVKRGGSVGGVVDMEDQESSGSNSFTVSSGQQQHWGGISSSSWEPNSADSTDCWTSRLMLGSDVVAEARKALNCKRREECDDHQHSSGIGRGRLGGSSSSKGLPHHTLPVVTAAAAAST